MEREHGRSAEDKSWQIMVTTGSQDGIAMMLDTIINPNDAILVEEPTYIGTLATLRPYNPTLVGIPIDQMGIIPELLAKRLDEWKDVNTKPKVLYLIPTGQNPSGSTMSQERREQVYKICSDHNILIIEDDPYWHLKLTTPLGNDPEPVKSLFSMDTEGRVIRLDSFSKIMSAGMRLGYMSLPTALFEKVEFVQQGTVLHTSGVSQALLLSVLKTWGTEGWLAHLKRVRAFYSQRRNVFLRCLEKHLTGVAEWWVPNAGMFVWIRLPGTGDTRDLVMKKCLEAKVIVVPGAPFMTDESQSCEYIRTVFSTASDEQMDEAVRRIALLVKK